MAIPSLGNYTASSADSTTKTRQAPSSSSLTMDNFMNLLAVQLQNQDMNSPMSNAEMMQQLTSMATVQSMNTFTELSSTQYALNLMGQEVRVAGTNAVTGAMEMKTGTVAGINLSSMKVYLEGDKNAYGLGNIMEVGVVPEVEDEKDPENNGNSDPNGPGGPGGSSNGNDDNNGSTAGISSKTSRSTYTDPLSSNRNQMPQDKKEAIARQNQIPEDKRMVLEAAAGKVSGPGADKAKTSKSGTQSAKEKPALDPRRV